MRESADGLGVKHSNVRELAETRAHVLAREEGQWVPIGHITRTKLCLIPAFPILELPEVLVHLVRSCGRDCAPSSVGHATSVLRIGVRELDEPPSFDRAT